jgi:hypothetical protein
MRGKATFFAGLAIGYVLGTRAGRERYEQITRAARKVRSNPTVQEAAGVVQSQTTKLVNTGRSAMRTRMNGQSRLANSKLGQRLLGSKDEVTLGERTGGVNTQGF